MRVLVERPLVFWAGGGQGKSVRFAFSAFPHTNLTFAIEKNNSCVVRELKKERERAIEKKGSET